MVRPGITGAAPQLLWPGSPPPVRHVRREAAVLQPRTQVGALATRSAGDGGRDHRVPGAYQWRVLFDTAGDPAWVCATTRRGAHVVFGDRPGLCSAGELDSRDQH